MDLGHKSVFDMFRKASLFWEYPEDLNLLTDCVEKLGFGDKDSALAVEFVLYELDVEIGT